MQAEREAQELRAELDSKKPVAPQASKLGYVSPRAMPQDVRRKYIERLEKLAKEALGQSPTSKYVRKKGLPPRGPPKSAVFKGRSDIDKAPAEFDPSKLSVRPVLTSADLQVRAS